MNTSPRARCLAFRLSFPRLLGAFRARCGAGGEPALDAFIGLLGVFDFFRSRLGQLARGFQLFAELPEPLHSRIVVCRQAR